MDGQWTMCQFLRPFPNFERVYQGSALLLSWVRTLGPGERFSASISSRATTGRDAALPDGSVPQAAPPRS